MCQSNKRRHAVLNKVLLSCICKGGTGREGEEGEEGGKGETALINCTRSL